MIEQEVVNLHPTLFSLTMPFTFSQPAAILPFSYLPKKYVSFTGLVVGSMIPDLEYFIHFSDTSYVSHTWAGLFWFDLPAALITCFIFHNLVRNELILHLPKPLLLRCVHCLSFNWNAWFRKKWLAIIFCIMVGTATHIIWDYLTHETTSSIEQTSYIQNKSIPGKNTVVYYLYWGLNSVIGMALLAGAFWKMPHPEQREIVSPSKKNYWSLILIISSVIVLIRVLINSNLNLVVFVDSCIAAFLIALLITSVVMRRYQQNSKASHKP